MFLYNEDFWMFCFYKPREWQKFKNSTSKQVKAMYFNVCFLKQKKTNRPWAWDPGVFILPVSFSPLLLITHVNRCHCSLYLNPSTVCALVEIARSWAQFHLFYMKCGWEEPGEQQSFAQSPRPPNTARYLPLQFVVTSKAIPCEKCLKSD